MEGVLSFCPFEKNTFKSTFRRWKAFFSKRTKYVLEYFLSAEGVFFYIDKIPFDIYLENGRCFVILHKIPSRVHFDSRGRFVLTDKIPSDIF